MRIYVPNVSSIVRTINPESGYYGKRLFDTLECMSKIPPILDTVSIGW